MAARPHLNQVELREEVHALGHAVGGGGALPDHVVDGHVHVVQQLSLQGEEAAGLVLSQPPPAPCPQLTWTREATFSSCSVLHAQGALVESLPPQGLSNLPCYEGH